MLALFVQVGGLGRRMAVCERQIPETHGTELCVLSSNVTALVLSSRRMLGRSVVVTCTDSIWQRDASHGASMGIEPNPSPTRIQSFSLRNCCNLCSLLKSSKAFG